MRAIDADKLRQDVLDWEDCPNGFSDTYDKARIIDEINYQPTLDVEPVRHGKWIERKVITVDKEEWQSAKCSVCGNYHTTPYMYYFSNYDYCPNCGAKMDEIEEWVFKIDEAEK